MFSILLINNFEIVNNVGLTHDGRYQSIMHISYPKKLFFTFEPYNLYYKVLLIKVNDKTNFIIYLNGLGNDKSN